MIHTARGAAILLCALAFFGALGGCASEQPVAKAFTKSNVDTARADKLERLVLVVPAEFAQGRSKPWPVLAARLRARGLVVDVVTLDPLELNRGETLRATVARADASHVVVLRMAQYREGWHRSGGWSNEGGVEDFETEIRARHSNSVIWRATTVVAYSDHETERHAEAVAASIIETLVADGLL